LFAHCNLDADDLMAYWRQKTTTLPKLAGVTRALLGVLATSNSFLWMEVTQLITCCSSMDCKRSLAVQMDQKKSFDCYLILY